MVSRTTPPSRRGERGQVLVLALLVTVILGLGLALIAAHLNQQSRHLRLERDELVLQAAVDAALAATLADIAGRRGGGGLAERQLPGGALIASRVESLPANRLRIIARATYHGHEREIEAEVEIRPSGPRVRSWRHRREDG